MLGRIRLTPRIAFALLLSLTLVGCRSWNSPFADWNWRGKGYDDDTNSLTKNLRPPADERQMTGFDARARDIERNLGVR
jgi:hypothetical protein